MVLLLLLGELSCSILIHCTSVHLLQWCASAASVCGAATVWGATSLCGAASDWGYVSEGLRLCVELVLSVRLRLWGYISVVLRLSVELCLCGATSLCGAASDWGAMSLMGCV